MTAYPFFDEKRPWSKRKDAILGHYFNKYIYKVGHFIKKPICVVDGFAGPGRFRKNNEEGSPLILAAAIQKARSGMRPVPETTLYCIEKEGPLHSDLTANLSSHAFCRIRKGEFVEHLPEVEEFIGDGKTLFLYVDPYAVEGLSWEALERTFRLLERRQSIEILLNFNALIFSRRGLAALGKVLPELDDPVEDSAPIVTPTAERLNKIAGGDWWQQELMDRMGDFPAQVNAMRDGYCRKLRSHFKEVLSYDIKEDWRYKVPKYSMLFGSRTDVAVPLINDAMAASRSMFAEQTIEEGVLIDTRTSDVVPDRAELDAILLKFGSDGWITRAALTTKSARHRIGSWTTSEMNDAVALLVESKRMVPRDPTRFKRKARLSDEAEVMTAGAVSA